MKILHICTGWPLSINGGITNYVRSLAYTQYNNGDDVYVMGLKDDVRYPFKYIEYQYKKIKPFTYSNLEDKDNLSMVQKVLNDNKFDIIHIHAIEGIDWDLYSVLKEYKYVVSLHDYCFICPRVYMYGSDKIPCEAYDEKKCCRCISYLDRFKIFRSGIPRVNRILKCNLHTPYIPQNITKRRYEKFSELLNNADYILPVSSKVESIFKNSGITAKSKVLHIGNDSSKYYEITKEYNKKPHQLKIVFLGRLSEYKGANLFLEIANHMKNNKNLEFHFLGRSGDYHELLLQNGIVDDGPYKPEDLNEILKGYDMGMVLSVWHDNGPQVVMELLNNHIPVIGTKRGGIVDFVDGSNGFIFEPSSKTEVDKLYDFLNNLNEKTVFELRQNIKRTVSPKEHYLELTSIYNEVISS